MDREELLVCRDVSLGYEHRAIVEAIANHDAAEAGRQMTRHITRAGEHMEQMHLL